MIDLLLYIVPFCLSLWHCYPSKRTSMKSNQDSQVYLMLFFPVANKAKAQKELQNQVIPKQGKEKQ